jgi:hypothetical protein
MIIDLINKLSKHLGYVYVIGYTYRGAGFKEDLIKIGVSDHPDTRFKTIQRNLPGRCSLLFVFPVISPYVIESQLLKRHKKYLQRPRKAGPGAGGDEFRDLPLTEYWFSLFVLLLASIRFYLLFYVIPLLVVGVFSKDAVTYVLAIIASI